MTGNKRPSRRHHHNPHPTGSISYPALYAAAAFVFFCNSQQDAAVVVPSSIVFLCSASAPASATLSSSSRSHSHRLSSSSLLLENYTNGQHRVTPLVPWTSKLSSLSVLDDGRGSANVDDALEHHVQQRQQQQQQQQHDAVHAIRGGANNDESQDNRMDHSDEENADIHVEETDSKKENNGQSNASSSEAEHSKHIMESDKSPDSSDKESNGTRLTSTTSASNSNASKSNSTTSTTSISNDNNESKPIPTTLQKKSKMKEMGGTIQSVLSFFRAQSSSASISPTIETLGGSSSTSPSLQSKNNKKTKILLPHGPDGRGGGGATASLGVSRSSKDDADSGEEEGESEDEQEVAEKFVITTTNVASSVGSINENDEGVATTKIDAKAGVSDDVSQTSSSKSPNNDKRSADKKSTNTASSSKTSGNAASAAFVIPPTALHSDGKLQTTKRGESLITRDEIDVAKQNAKSSSDKKRVSPTNAQGPEALSVTSDSTNRTTLVKTSVNVTMPLKSTRNETLNQTTTKSASPKSNATLKGDTSKTTSTLSANDYTSSGYWVGIDLIASFGLSALSDDLKLSRALRPVRKAAAKATGLHGVLSGKEHTAIKTVDDNENDPRKRKPTVISIDEELGIHDSGASEAEIVARRVVRSPLRRRRDMDNQRRQQNRVVRRWGLRRGGRRNNNDHIGNNHPEYLIVPAKNLDSSPDAMEERRRKRVEEIDKLIQRGSARLLELQCEKDDLQLSKNPLFNYTQVYNESTNQTFGDVRTSREFNFPPSDLVNEYIDELVSNGRLIRLNHTDLWQSRSNDGLDDDDDEIIGDDLFTPSADARRLYENLDELERGMNNCKNRNNGRYVSQNSGGGSWLLRTGFGRSKSIGEQLGETIETAAYKAVCSSVMMVLARLLSALHGTNIMSHSDIRLYIEQDPDLPPVDKKYGPMSGDNYAQEAIKTAIRKGSKKKKKGGKSSHRHSSRQHGHELSDDAFMQRDAVVETLISHCQISAPLLKLFPLDWQRAMVGNIITLVTAVVSDFADGLQVQILGHALSFSFKPITEADMIQQIGVGGFRQNHRRARPEEFEAAVWATAQDISESLSFLDGWLEWFERKLGGGILRSQIGNLIARVVLTLIDEVLSGARLDLWSSQANGPRLFAALEYRTTPQSETIDQC